MPKKKNEDNEQKQTQKERIAELELKVDALSAALWEVTKLSVISTSDGIPPPKASVAITGLAGVAIKLQDGGLAEPGS